MTVKGEKACNNKSIIISSGKKKVVEIVALRTEEKEREEKHSTQLYIQGLKPTLQGWHSGSNWIQSVTTTL